MKIAIYSDIHGNLPALEIAIKASGEVDGYIILGDVVNYGPWSNDCVKKLETLPNCKKIIGNHEEYFINGNINCGNNLATNFFNHCYSSFTEFETIKKYVTKINFENFTCVHTINDQYIFDDTIISIDNDYIIGHSQRQFKNDKNKYLILNPGSVGQNREYINKIEFMIFNTDSKGIEFFSKSYDVNIVITEMIKLNYPKICIDYYKNKPVL